MPEIFWRSTVSNYREVCMGSKSISRQSNGKPPAAAVPSFVFTSKKKEDSIGSVPEIATVSWATPALSKTVTDVSTKPTVMSAK